MAVGAPGDGEGAVYIFNGRSKGMDWHASQTIRPSVDLSNPVGGFGISISGGEDVNSDSYGDIAVSAYQGGGKVGLEFTYDYYNCRLVVVMYA